MNSGLKDTSVILIFAVAHAATALACRCLGLQDDVLLTILTMLLTMLICMRGRMSTMFMAIAILLINIFGFALGFLFSELFGFLSSNPLFIYPASTFLTTIIIGYSISGFATLYGRRRRDEGSEDALIWLLLAFIIVITVRLILIIPLSDEQVRRDSINMLLNYTFSGVALAVVVVFTIRALRQRDEELERAHLAQYRYMKLKQQVNPHFLFNSLNILDCMIQEQSPERASLYTHKLADVYRYMIRNEEEKLVPLSEEMDFVEKYVSLLMVRFTEGLQIESDIPPEAMRRRVAPCCLQLLIENATKHNAVRPDNPLKINIFIEGDDICVTNNLSPKVGRHSSTGLGLAYIKQQYMDLSGKEIEARKTETEFIAKLPLL